MKHPHAAFINEALQDMSREIEAKHRTDDWEPSNINHVVACAESWQFRFKPKQPAVVSTLSDSALREIFVSHYRAANSNLIESARALVNAAAAEERKRICSLPAVTRIEWLGITYIKVKDAHKIIAQFLKDIESGVL